MPVTGDITSYFEVFAGEKWPLTIMREKAGEMVPVPATFHHFPVTSNLFNNSALKILFINLYDILKWNVY